MSVYQSLLKKLNYQFESEELLELALTHRSVNSSNNERLEYLGDAILGMVVAEALYDKFPEASEGQLTRKRASLVKKEALASIAKTLELGEVIKLGEGEKRSGGWRHDSTLSNTFEALVGAIYLDSDFYKCRDIVRDIYKSTLEHLSLEDSAKDAKTELQEFLQARKLTLPKYEIVSETGDAHDKLFTVSCKVDFLDASIEAQGKANDLQSKLQQEKL